MMLSLGKATLGFIQSGMGLQRVSYSWMVWRHHGWPVVVCLCTSYIIFITAQVKRFGTYIWETFFLSDVPYGTRFENLLHLLVVVDVIGRIYRSQVGFLGSPKVICKNMYWALSICFQFRTVEVC